MKKIIIMLISIFLLSGCADYVEINDLAIIKGVGVSYKNSSYTIYMKEIIPARSDDGIEYKYKIYEASADDLESALEKVADKTKKKLYYKRCKFLVTDVDNSDFINEMLEIKPKSIYHPSNDVKDVLAKTNS